MYVVVVTVAYSKLKALKIYVQLLIRIDGIRQHTILLSENIFGHFTLKISVLS